MIPNSSVERHSPNPTSRIAVVVLGDFGHSPRMQYHALSLANAGHAVDVVSYAESSLPMWEISEHGLIALRAVTRGHFAFAAKWPAACRLLLRAIAQFIHLTFILCTIQRPKRMVVQNPPCVPTFLACGVVCWMRGIELVIDWHNLAFTLFGMKYGSETRVAKMCERHERKQGKMWASKHMCVTDAMREFLETEWGMTNVSVVRDRAAEQFRIAARTRAEANNPMWFWKQTRVQEELEKSRVARSGDVLDRYVRGHHENLHRNKPRIVVSSTSWTPDENFGILLDAAIAYDARKRTSGGVSSYESPDLVIIITGKGPEREMYEQKINTLALKHVAFRTVWLDIADYPLALASAHLGVCLHTSSSGLDLPMKVLDMFGASLPVAAVRYEVVEELIEDGVNGVLFSDAEELCKLLQKLLSRKNKYILTALRAGAEKAGELTWNDHWNEHAKPLFSD